MVVVQLLVYKLAGEISTLTERMLLKPLCRLSPPIDYAPRSGLLLAPGFLLLVRLVPQARVVVLVAT
jgi:hypothetical protein